MTTNRIFSEWAEVFPNAVSIVALADRLCHKAEVLTSVRRQALRRERRAVLRSRVSLVR